MLPSLTSASPTSLERTASCSSLLRCSSKTAPLNNSFHHHNTNTNSSSRNMSRNQGGNSSSPLNSSPLLMSHSNTSLLPQSSSSRGAGGGSNTGSPHFLMGGSPSGEAANATAAKNTNLNQRSSAMPLPRASASPSPFRENESRPGVSVGCPASPPSPREAQEVPPSSCDPETESGCVHAKDPPAVVDVGDGFLDLGVVTLDPNTNRLHTRNYKKDNVFDHMSFRSIPYDGKNPNNHNPNNNDPYFRNKSNNNNNGRRYDYMNPNLHPELLHNAEILATHVEEHPDVLQEMKTELAQAKATEWEAKREKMIREEDDQRPESDPELAGEPYAMQEHILRHKAHFATSDNKTHSVVIAFDTKQIEPVIQKAFDTPIRHDIRQEAHSTYIFKMKALKRRNLEQDEEREREDIIGDMTAFFEAFLDWQTEVRERLFGQKTFARALQHLQEKLDAQQLALDVMQVKDEDTLKEEGRRAWRLEIEEQARLDVEAKARETARVAVENLRRRAIIFISTDEQRFRKALEAEVAAGYDEILELQKEFLKERERLAYEAFIYSPEQLALAAERAKHERKEKLKAAKEKKKRQKEQTAMIQGCTHGPQNTSVFVGKKAKQSCFRCRIKFDENLGYYVSMDVHPTMGSVSAQPTPSNTRRPTVEGGGASASASGKKKRSVVSGAGELPQIDPTRAMRKSTLLAVFTEQAEGTLRPEGGGEQRGSLAPNPCKGSKTVGGLPKGSSPTGNENAPPPTSKEVLSLPRAGHANRNGRQLNPAATRRRSGVEKKNSQDSSEDRLSRVVDSEVAFSSPIPSPITQGSKK